MRGGSNRTHARAESSNAFLHHRKTDMRRAPEHLLKAMGLANAVRHVDGLGLTAKVDRAVKAMTAVAAKQNGGQPAAPPQ